MRAIRLGWGRSIGQRTRVVLVDAGRSVWPVAVAASDSAQGEVLFKLDPFGVGGLAVLLGGPLGAAV
jgi:hypothetical protein